MTTENEHTAASSQISEDETQKMHKKRHVVGVVFASDCVETHQPHGHTRDCSHTTEFVLKSSEGFCVV